MTISRDLKNEIIRKRGNFCECGCHFWGHDLHHCLIPRQKRFAEWLDDERNLALVNHEQHIARKFDNLEWRKKFFLIQARRYGYNKMIDWVMGLPLKLENRLDFLPERLPATIQITPSGELKITEKK